MPDFLPHVDGSGRGLDDGECIHCGTAGSLDGWECPVRLREALDADHLDSLRDIGEAVVRHIASPGAEDDAVEHATVPEVLGWLRDLEADREALRPLREPDPKNRGMRVDFGALVTHAKHSKAPKLLKFALGELEGHLHEMKRRVDAGDYAAVHELLDLYCIDGKVTRG